MQAGSTSLTDPNQEQLQALYRLGWYHSIELPDGRVIEGFQSIERLRTRIAQFPIPRDLRGKRVLDIGAWDGWFSFEMERRGAEVVAIDSTPHERFRIAHELLGSKVEYRVDDVCRLSRDRLGSFDIVMFLGVLYHLKHPLLALEKVCELATSMVCVESFVTDDGSDLSAKPVMEFYESNELCGQFDNWVGPNVSCLLAMCRTAGFAGVQLESVLDHRAHVTCFRQWPEIVDPREPAPYVTSVENAATHQRHFSSVADDYVTVWFKSPQPDLSASDVFPQVGPYGSHPVFLRSTGGDGWHVNCKLPPGLSPGWHEVTVRTRHSDWGNRVRVGVDLSPEDQQQLPPPAQAADLRIAVVTDGRTWERNIIHGGVNSCLSLWVSGLPPGATTAGLLVRLGEFELRPVFLSEADPHGLRQVNVMRPAEAQPGDYAIAVSFESAVSETAPVKLL